MLAALGVPTVAKKETKMIRVPASLADKLGIISRALTDKDGNRIVIADYVADMISAKVDSDYKKAVKILNKKMEEGL